MNEQTQGIFTEHPVDTDAMLDVDTEVNSRDLWEPTGIVFYCGQKTEPSK